MNSQRIQNNKQLIVDKIWTDKKSENFGEVPLDDSKEFKLLALKKLES